MQRADVTDARAWGEVDVGAGLAVTVELISLSLQYQSTIVSSETELASLVAAERNFIVDVPIQRMVSCGRGKYDDQVFPLPKNTKVVFLSFLHEDQFIMNVGLHKFLSPRFRFAPNLINCQLSLPGRDGLLAAQGLTNLGVAACSNSSSLKSYHRGLVKAGVYEKLFSSYAPSHIGGIKWGYDQSLVIPLRDYDIEENSQLRVVCQYSDQLAQARWHIHLFCIVQRQLERTTGKKWSWKEL